MTHLSDFISVADRYARSANLERDTNQLEALNSYVVTSQALDFVDRIVTAATSGQAGGAWTLTGPYGSGKSSLALLLDAALGAPSKIRDCAWKAINAASDEVGAKLVNAHNHHSTLETGFNRGLVTAQREPLTHTVLRALEAAAHSRWGQLPTTRQLSSAQALRSLLDEAAKADSHWTGPESSALVEVACDMARDRPLLIVIDEFGKALETIGEGTGAQSDPYLLQQLAEAGQGSGLPIFIVTLQHLSFEDYLSTADKSLRQEWAKVQGRFENVTFTESPGQTRKLISTVFNVRDNELRSRIDGWAAKHAESMSALGIQELADAEAIAACYPLHPLTTLVLPELCSRFGQNERTLFTFLASNHEHGAASFLAHTPLPGDGQLPALGLHDAFEYFVGKAFLPSLPSGASSRLAEIATRLRDVTGLTERQRQIACCIGLLNIVSTSGTVRASQSLLRLIDVDVDKTIGQLEKMGVITYREFADEYRVWQGSDVDLGGQLKSAREQVAALPLVDVLRSLGEPSPVVAARHSAERALFRVFSRSYVDGSNALEPLSAMSSFDGEVVLVVGDELRLPGLKRSGPNEKPIVAALPTGLTALDRAARDLAALKAMLEEPKMEHDWVVRRELSERLAQATSMFDDALLLTFSPNNCKWVLLDGESGVDLPAGRGSAPLSYAANLAYSDVPYVPNEMINRTVLTSQGAKTRRVLLEAMIEQGHKPKLGFEGFGPEVAMYQAVLAFTGLHGSDPKSDSMLFRPPNHESMKGAWKALEADFKKAKSRRINLTDIYSTLMSPPFGMKEGVIPIFVTAGLLNAQDQVAIYEHGTFSPKLTPEISERMVRNPSHFEFKHFASSSGARRQVVSALAEQFALQPGFRKHKANNILAVVGHFVSMLRGLEKYAFHTHSLKPATLKVRHILLEAVEPDVLLFEALPGAFELPPVPPHAKTYKRCSEFVDRVAEALEELTTCYEKLLTELFEQLLEEFAETQRLAVSGQAAALENEVLNPEIRAFAQALANDSKDNDLDWIQAVATVLSKKAPTEWTDEDRARFSYVLNLHVAAVHRLVALHADRRAHSDGQIDVARIVITSVTGQEFTRLVEIAKGANIEESLSRFIEDLARDLGSITRAEQALLAAISNRLLPVSEDNVVQAPMLHAEQGGQNA